MFSIFQNCQLAVAYVCVLCYRKLLCIRIVCFHLVCILLSRPWLPKEAKNQ